jgi:hypothetical protein
MYDQSKKKEQFLNEFFFSAYRLIKERINHPYHRSCFVKERHQQQQQQQHHLSLRKHLARNDERSIQYKRNNGIRKRMRRRRKRSGGW